jgi:2'-phosphotransferase
VVIENDKQRFTLCRTSELVDYAASSSNTIDENDNETTSWWIRANQGHSLTVNDLALDVITDPTELTTLLHGTYHRYWPSIGMLIE